MDADSRSSKNVDGKIASSSILNLFVRSHHLSVASISSTYEERAKERLVDSAFLGTWTWLVEKMHPLLSAMLLVRRCHLVHDR